eukprot:9589212-Ditylum_brightwellii.AAC.1
MEKYSKTSEKPDTSNRKDLKGTRKDLTRFKKLVDFEQHANSLHSSFTRKYTNSKDTINTVEDMVSTSSMPRMVEWSHSILLVIVDDGSNGGVAKKHGEDSLSMLSDSSSLSLSYQDFDFGNNLHTSVKIVQPGLWSSRRYNVNIAKPIQSLYSKESSGDGQWQATHYKH